MVPGCRQESTLVNVAHQFGIEVLFEALNATEALARKTTPDIDLHRMLHGSNDFLFTRQIPDPSFRSIQIHRHFV